MASLPSVLLLDMDDTILDDTGARNECWRIACQEAEKRNPSLDAGRLLREIELVRELFWSDPDRHRQWRTRMREAWTQIATDALARLGIDDPVLGAFIGDRHFALRDASIRPLPGALETLKQLRRLGVTLGLITNGGSSDQRAKIERFALAANFAYIGIEGELGFGKPDHLAYATALRSLHVSPQDAWMVGDNLDWDVAGAQAANIYAVWLDRFGSGLPSGRAVKPDRVIQSLPELLPG